MSSTGHEIISPMYDVITRIKPLSVLDVGLGFGRNGVEIRNLLETTHYMKIFKHERVVRVDGIEIFEKYRNPIWDFAYDRIWVGNIVEMLDHTRESYDLIMMTDVIEHIEKSQGEALLKRLMARANLGVMLSHPWDDQSNLVDRDLHGNTHESHVSLWGASDYERLGYDYKELVHRSCFFLRQKESSDVLFESSLRTGSSNWNEREQFYSLSGRILECSVPQDPITWRVRGGQVTVAFVATHWGSSRVRVELDGQVRYVDAYQTGEPTFRSLTHIFEHDGDHTVRICIEPDEGGRHGVQVTRMLVRATRPPARIESPADALFGMADRAQDVLNRFPRAHGLLKRATRLVLSERGGALPGRDLVRGLTRAWMGRLP